MSYLVLARKYRPQTFADIVGQEHVTRTLRNAIEQQRIHHAFLFTGARGVGKTTAARILAKALSCDKGPTAEPCNQCDACTEITNGASVDVQEIDAASNNGVEAIRDLREAIRYAPVRGKKKVYILDEVHMLSGSAWNALLKTLEEPPPHAIFVFATTDPHKLPATILSRVQRYDFRLVSSKALIAHLQSVLERESIAFEPGALALIAREAGGSVRDSLSLLDQVIASVGGTTLVETQVAAILGVADRGLLRNIGEALFQKNPERALALLEEAFTHGYDLSQLAQALLGHLRDLLVAASVQNPAALSSLIEASQSELEELQQAARKLPQGLLELMFARLSRIAEEVAKAAQPRYVLEVGLLDLIRVEPLEDLAALLGKVEDLERRLESRGTPSAPAHSPSGGGGGGGPRAAPEVKPAAAPAPTPAPAPAPARAPQSFTEVIEALIAAESRLSLLAQARKISFDESRLVLGFDKSFAADGIKERLPILRTTLLKVLGRDLTVEIVVGAPVSVEDSVATETLIEVEQRKVDEDHERRRKEALEHPMRKTLDDRFGGTWKDPIVDD